MSMKIGQRVILNKGEPSQAFGYFAGAGMVERHPNNGMDNMYIIMLDPEYRGYVQSNSGKNSFVGMVVAHPDNVEVID